MSEPTILVALAAPFILSFASSKLYPYDVAESLSSMQVPSWQPPNSIFGPIWTFLYVCMGFASYRIWSSHKKYPILSNIWIAVYVMQLIINVSWSPVFFGNHEYTVAFYMVLVMIGLVVLLIITGFYIDRRASIAMVPYLLWISFAAYLTWTIKSLNS
jgi:tryptophan-rich sensory protein